MRVGGVAVGGDVGPLVVGGEDVADVLVLIEAEFDDEASVGCEEWWGVFREVMIQCEAVTARAGQREGGFVIANVWRKRFPMGVADVGRIGDDEVEAGLWLRFIGNVRAIRMDARDTITEFMMFDISTRNF